MRDVADIYLTPEQVAERLQLGVETVYRWLRSGKLRGSRISQKAWRVPERELTSFVKRRNVSELLFEEYVEEYELGELEHEPQYPGASRRIDYRLLHNGQCLWFEVKEFSDDPALTGSGGGAFDPHVGIRAKIGKAGAKFQHYGDECCSLVLFNEHVNLVDICTPRIVLGAMLGSVGFRIPIDPIRGTQAGPIKDNVIMDGGKLIHPHIKKPQNTKISAVIALQRFAIGQREHQIKVEQREQAEQRSLSLAEYLEMLDANRAAYSRQVLRTTVYENPHARHPLPRDVFIGPFDERWGQRDEYIAPVFVGLEMDRLYKIEHELELDRSPLFRHPKRRERLRRPTDDKSKRQRNRDSPEI